jgi:hypothetical protein
MATRRFRKPENRVRFSAWALRGREVWRSKTLAPMTETHQVHNLETTGSNPVSATKPLKRRWRRTWPVPAGGPFKSVEGLQYSGLVQRQDLRLLTA